VTELCDDVDCDVVINLSSVSSVSVCSSSCKLAPFVLIMHTNSCVTAGVHLPHSHWRLLHDDIVPFDLAYQKRNGNTSAYHSARPGLSLPCQVRTVCVRLTSSCERIPHLVRGTDKCGFYA
jgi:hypothetical protein